MSDGIRLHCPSCGAYSAIQKGGDTLSVKLRIQALKHPEDEEWYASSIPVYTCSLCQKQWAIERVNT